MDGHAVSPLDLSQTLLVGGGLLLLLLLLLSRFSRVRLLATPWTAAHQAPPPMGFSRQESRGSQRVRHDFTFTFFGASNGKAFACNAGDLGLIPE